MVVRSSNISIESTYMMTSSNRNIFCYRPFVWGIHWSPVNSPLKGQWRGALMFSLICALNKWLSRQLWGWWFEMSSQSLWHHCNDFVPYCLAAVYTNMITSMSIGGTIAVNWAQLVWNLYYCCTSGAIAFNWVQLVWNLCYCITCGAIAFNWVQLVWNLDKCSTWCYNFKRSYSL